MKNKYVEITGTKIIRDVSNMSLINTDRNELQEYLNRRNYLLKQKEEMDNIKQDVSNMKDDISQIKDLLIKLVGK